MKKSLNLYSISLHAALVALSVITLLLVQENRRLASRLAPPPAGPEIGQALDPLEWQALGGDVSTLDFAAAGQESLLLIFTTECPACQQNQEAWRTLHSEVEGAANVVGISLSELEATRSYREANALPFPVGIPAKPQEFSASLSISAVPMTIRVGADGRVRGIWNGTLSERQLSELSRNVRG